MNIISPKVEQTQRKNLMKNFSEEDNDDIIPIIERHSIMLRQLYGEFYISELISRHPESERMILVCEVSTLANSSILT